MIWGSWVDPNYRFTAVDQRDEPQSEICYAASVDELIERLEKKGMKQVVVAKYDFAEWKKRARRATDKVIWERIKDRWSYFQGQARDQWDWLIDDDIDAIKGEKRKLKELLVDHDGCSEEEAVQQIDAWSSTLAEEDPRPGQILPKTAFNFNADLWKDLRWHLFELFHGKCAYCEHKPLAGAWGDVEHYRPKGKVDEDENHPGYYWLAYDHSNYLPSCVRCNQYGAKLTHFPVIGAHSRDSRRVAGEQPLLLNPYDRQIDPFQHLEFDAAGVPQPLNKSPYGVNSRDIYYLQRYDLIEARLAAIQLVERDWNTRIDRKVSIVGAYRELRQEILAGEREYSAALLWELKRLRQRTIDELTDAPDIGAAPATQGP